jgi:hypothetical protein
MRPTAEQAMVRVQEYIDFLETNGVPTALFKERVQAVHAWGKSVRLRQPDAANPRSEEMKGIQRALDDAVASENFVRENRKRHPFYPYQTEEQHRLAELRAASTSLRRRSRASSRPCTEATARSRCCVRICRTASS